MTTFFLRLRWHIILILAALRQGWPISRRGRAWYAGATGMEASVARAHIESDRKMADALRYAFTGRGRAVRS